MTSHVVGFDVMKVSRLFEPWNLPIQMFQPSIQFRITTVSTDMCDRILVSDCANICPKVLDIDWIEAHDGDIKTNIRLGEL